MGWLTRPKGRKTWVFRAEINGQEVAWSTGETNKHRAMAKKAELEAKAQSLRDLSAASSKKNGGKLKLTEAINLEVARLKRDVSARRSERVDYMLGNFLGWVGEDLPLTKINYDLLEAYQCHRLEQVSKYTTDAELTAIKRMLESSGLHVVKPKPKPGRREIVRPFTMEELPLFFEHIAKDFVTLFMTMLATGARPAEVVPSNRSKHKPLLKSEVNFKEGIVTIRNSKLKLGEEEMERPVSVEPYLLERLREQIKSMPKEYPYVFLPMARLSRVFIKAVSRAGIPDRDARGRKLTAHSFRHTYATHHSENGCDQFKLMKALGHKNIATTARYVHNLAPRIKMDLQAMAPEVEEMPESGGAVIVDLSELGKLVSPPPVHSPGTVVDVEDPRVG